MDTLVRDKIAAAARQGDKLTAEDARAEIAADFTELIFADTKTLRRFVEANSRTAEGRNMLQRLWDAVRRFVASLKKTQLSIDAETAKNLGLGSVIYQLEQAERLYREVLAEGARSRTGVSGDSGKAMKTIRRTQSMSWEEHINGLLYNGKNIHRNDTLVIGYPSADIKSVSNKPLAIPTSIINKAMSEKDYWHSIKRGKIAKLDEGIKNAPLIITNPERNALVYVTNIKQGGFPIVVAFDMNNLFDGDDVHKATSIHLQGDVMVMLNGLPASATVYVQKNNELNSVGASNNLRGLAAKVKFIDTNIPQPDAPVNSKQSAKYTDVPDALRRQYGEIKPGEKPVRESHVPKKTEKNKKVSQTVRTIIEARATPDGTKTLQNVQCCHRWAGNQGILKSSNKNIPK